MGTASHAPTPSWQALAWSLDRLALWSGDGERIAITLNVPAQERYFLQLRRTGSAVLWLHAPLTAGPSVVRLTQRGQQVEPAPPIPSAGPDTRCRFHLHQDAVTALNHDRLYVLGTHGEWQPRPLPEGMHAQDVSFDHSGGLWVAGAVPSLRLPGAAQEMVLVYQPAPGQAFQARTPRLSLVSTAAAIQAGGMQRLRLVDAEAEPLVAVADCAWFMDDPSSFIFVRSHSGRWRVRRLAERSIRRILRPAPGRTLAVSAEGEFYTIAAAGSLHSLGSPTALRKALLASAGPGLDQAQLIVRGADADQTNLFVAAGLCLPGRSGLEWPLTAICHSANGGRSWSLLEHTQPAQGEPELLDVALQRGTNFR